MIVALDVGYTDNSSDAAGGVAGGTMARCGVVAFREWTSTSPEHTHVVSVPNVAPYVPGQLFERELPALIAGLDAMASLAGGVPECVIVDGNVRLDQSGRPGLGLHLHDHLPTPIAVVGVAKSVFAGLEAQEVLRGSSRRPLYVTAIGIEEARAALLVGGMAGGHRIPTMLKIADQLSRGR